MAVLLPPPLLNGLAIKFFFVASLSLSWKKFNVFMISRWRRGRGVVSLPRGLQRGLPLADGLPLYDSLRLQAKDHSAYRCFGSVWLLYGSGFYIRIMKYGSGSCFGADQLLKNSKKCPGFCAKGARKIKLLFLAEASTKALTPPCC